ncbi:hypothetical protein ABZT17_26940 [Streptomyces sp. NPDC005648]|uniref:hypothetical protein n=1 Tax=Streptomyces sp. NPDC005648 TaxID=3157044 RepID=UPI0033B587F8
MTMNSDTLAVPRLKWRRVSDEQFTTQDADGVRWSVDRHPTDARRQGKDPDWSPKWWLHQLDHDGLLRETAETHETCPIVTSRQIIALNRHRDVLRYADVLAAGWDNACWRIQNGHPLAEQVFRRDGQHAPLSALLGDPVMVHPQRLLNAELRSSRFERRAYAAEQSLRDAGLPLPNVERP